MAEAETHGYFPSNYTATQDPLLLKQLEWFKDQKLALMMHWGVYSQMGIIESWPLVDQDKSWSRSDVDWNSGDDFKKEYRSMNRSFNPVRFMPEQWAALAADNGFKYLIFTTKHHDGFCMYDSKYTDFKITSPDCPFSANKNADAVKAVFDAFRAKGVKIAAYFSKSDWNNEDYWENKGIGYETTRNPSYDTAANPEKWERFAQFVKNQILELVENYGRLEVIWLDGGQVCRNNKQDIHIEDIIEAARKIQPWLLSADRTVGGICENYITPEQTVPSKPLEVPWESCITMGTGFSYRYDETYKPLGELIVLLIDIVAKGGNLALNVAPGPDGRIGQTAIERIKGIGSWLKINGEAIYGTRPAAPYRAGNFAFTQKDGNVYAIRIYNETDCECGCFTINDFARADEVKDITALSNGESLKFQCAGGALYVSARPELKTNPYADAFKLSF